VAIGGLEMTAWVTAEGRQAAFEVLLRTNEKRVLRTAWRLLGSLEDAKDASQEVFLKLHKHFERLDPASTNAWIYRTTVNVCMDQHRRRRPEGELDIDPPAPATQHSGLEAAEDKRRLERAIGRLPEKERAALVLREIEGLETSRVAEILGVTDATVRSQVASAKTKLKEWLS
jgi:RNA polymerase sigma-70 factor (ECF subfamily)